MREETALIQALYQINVFQFGSFKLKSGVLSPFYINLRKIISYPTILRQVANAMWPKMANCQFDVICGVPYTALPIATCLSLQHNIPMVLRRKEKKEYGTGLLIEGEFEAGQHCLIVEDVMTTGSSMVETAETLQAAGLVVEDLIVLIDREQGGMQNLANHYRVQAVLSLNMILTTLFQSTYLKESERISVASILEKGLVA